jgi:hypothetical protein
MHLKKLLWLGAISGAALTTQAQVRVSIGLPGIIVVREAPPAPRYEDRGPQPGPDFFWVEGHWARDRDHWEWIRGHWDRSPRPEAVWVPGHWDRREDGWVWIDGHWVDRDDRDRHADRDDHRDRDDHYAPPPPPPEVRVDQDRPPEAYREEVPPPPGPDFFWVQGHWIWQDRWVWFHGHYEHRRHDRDWHEGRYEHHPEGWIWIEGGWR